MGDTRTAHRMRDFHHPGRSPVYATHGMAATSMPAASLAAVEVLRGGGNAVDAAVAAAAVLAVVEPQSTGIGGDCFCLYKPAGGAVVALNGSGRAPAGASLEGLRAVGYVTPDLMSAHTVTVPGAVGAWEALLDAHGTRGLGELLRPAIGHAEDGFAVTPRVSADWAGEVGKLRAQGTGAFLPGGAAPVAGDVFRQAALGRTLRRIAERGAAGFYEGEVAADIVATLRARGGLHTEADFAEGAGAAMFVAPISADWQGHTVWECPPNGSGLVALMILGMLEAMAEARGPAPDGPLGTVRLHRHIEAARLAYRDRDAFVADPSQVEVPVARLLDKGYLASLAALVDDRRAMAAMPRAGEALLPAHRDTVYLSVVDRDGNACSFINSLFMSFGSGILAEASGVMLHNRGFGFRLEEGHPNCIAPGKRPMHTILPAMLTQGGEAVMPFGVMGGHFQPMGQTLLLSNMLEHGLDVQQAIDLPRLFPFAGKVEVERGVPEAVVAALAEMGHAPERLAVPHGGAQAIWTDRARGVLVGGSEPRKDGMALGY